MKGMKLMRKRKKKGNKEKKNEEINQDNNNNNNNIDNNNNKNNINEDEEEEEEKNENFEKKISFRERRRIQKEKEKKEKEEKEKEIINENNKELKIKGKNKNLKEFQSENPLNNNDLEEINEDDEYIYDLIDINDEIKKHIKLSKIIENKINYPIRKYFNHWKELSKFEQKINKLKGKYINSLMNNLENTVIQNKNNELNESNESSSSKNSIDVKKKLKFTIGISLLKKLFKKFYIQNYFQEFMKEYLQNLNKGKFKKIISINDSNNLINLLNILTSADYNIFSTIIKLTEETDKNLLNILGKKAKIKLMNFLKNGDLDLSKKSDDNLKITKESKVIVNRNIGEEKENENVEIFKETKTITTRTKTIRRRKKDN